MTHIQNETDIFLSKKNYENKILFTTEIKNTVGEYCARLVNIYAEEIANNPLILSTPGLITLENQIKEVYAQILQLAPNPITHKILDKLLEGFTKHLTVGKGKMQEKEKQKAKLKSFITKNDYHLFMIGAGQGASNMKIARTIQLRLTYTLLYYLGVNLNMIRYIQKQDLLDAIETSTITVQNVLESSTDDSENSENSENSEKSEKSEKSKKKKIQRYTLCDEGREKLESLKDEIFVLFEEHEFKYLGNSKRSSAEVFNETNFIRLVNNDLKKTIHDLGLKVEKGDLSSSAFKTSYVARGVRKITPKPLIENIKIENLTGTTKLLLQELVSA
jgi:hypothetical protein